MVFPTIKSFFYLKWTWLFSSYIVVVVLLNLLYIIYLQLIMTHCQIRPILTFIFSIFHFFSEVKKGSFKWSVLDFIVFPKRFCPIETKNSTFQSYKNTHFSWLIAQILYKNENPILERNFICKVCTIVLENWAFLWLWKVLFLVSMGQNLLGKIII